MGELIAVMENFKPTDYMLALGLAYFVIKELFKLLGKKKDVDGKENFYSGLIMKQHEKIIDRLEDIGATLQTISAVSKSTNDKAQLIKDDCIAIKERLR